MHRIFTVWEILRSIVIEYSTLEENTWNSKTGGNQYRRALLRLAVVRVFSPFALELLWRDTNLVQLSLSPFDWQSLAQRQGQGVSGTMGPRDRIRFVKVVLPMFDLHELPQDIIHVLHATDAFAPHSIYCVPPTRVFDSRKKAMDRYGMLFKESVVDVFLYVEADQPFCWSPLLSRLPKSLRQLSILSMVPLVKDAEPGPALSFHETRNLLATFTGRGDTLRTIELRFLHLDMIEIVLEKLGQLPQLKCLLLACPRRNRAPFPVHEPLLPDDGNLEHWSMLETLHIGGYPLGTMNSILQTSQSTALTAVTIKTSSVPDSTPLSLVCLTLAQNWSRSLVKLRFEGPTTWNDDPVIDVDRIMQALGSLVNLRTLYIDSHHVMSHLHLQHLISIGSTMHRLQALHLLSLSEATEYASNLKLFDLLALSPLRELLFVAIEMGQIRVNTPAEDEHYPHSPDTVSSSKIDTINVFSSTYDASALSQCSGLFPRVTTIQHISASHVDIESSGLLSL